MNKKTKAAAATMRPVQRPVSEALLLAKCEIGRAKCFAHVLERLADSLDDRKDADAMSVVIEGLWACLNDAEARVGSELPAIWAA
ncbi:hypothetical protein IP69_21225 [Bosea sp. AAP35]|uniref:hypothetical protein n=1 Tax=Bosea sp. AAP35 TaxID=1523417 RepID=UPI0006B9F75B|nr:hypothetical protein [Bosea sp. AAP35]KPF62139.1 hypothetical protein IP69_21225 [Bosea sp. AAP35]